MGGHQNIIVNGSPQWAHNGYSVVATARNNNNHTRLRGCLKHVSYCSIADTSPD